MPIVVWSLLAFAVWTLLTLAATVGVYRWMSILGSGARLADFGQYKVEGKGWYKRALRAHANCVENLPVFGAIVFATVVSGVESTALDVLALVVIGARIPHTLVHVAFEQESVVVAFRSALFNTQWLCMVAMAVIVAVAAT